VLNGFQVAMRRGRITAAYRDASLADLRALAITIDRGANRQAWSATLRLCDRFGLTPYDAAYFELALRRRFPLATLDGELIRAARAENVPLVGAV
jgi:predicted nucleic acid-binding protein